MDDEAIEEVVDEADLIPAAPWYNTDTAAAALNFAANMAAAAAHHFQSLALLAAGQSQLDWAKNDKQELVDDMLSSLQKLGGEDDG